MKTTIAHMSHITQRTTHKQETQSDSQSEFYTSMQLQIQTILDSAWKACLCVVETTQAMLAGARTSGRSRTTQGRRGALASGYVVAIVSFCLLSERQANTNTRNKKQNLRRQAPGRLEARFCAGSATPKGAEKPFFLEVLLRSYVCVCVV